MIITPLVNGVPHATGFVDDFSNPALGRYYNILQGIGDITRGPDGLRYDITRAPDGAANAGDRLAIDSLGRPSSPTAKAVLRFRGDEWTIDAVVDYGFESKTNCRGAYFWVVGG